MGFIFDGDKVIKDEAYSRSSGCLNVFLDFLTRKVSYFYVCCCVPP